MPVEMSAASDDSFNLASSLDLFELEVSGFRICSCIFSCSKYGKILFSAALINLVSAAAGIIPERPSKSCDLQASSRGEMAGPFQDRPRSSYSRAVSLRPPVQEGPHQFPWILTMFKH